MDAPARTGERAMNASEKEVFPAPGGAATVSIRCLRLWWSEGGVTRLEHSIADCTVERAVQ